MVMRSMLTAMVVGWFVSAWVPVPGFVRSTANMAATTLANGLKAMAGTVQPVDSQVARKPGPGAH